MSRRSLCIPPIVVALCLCGVVSAQEFDEVAGSYGVSVGYGVMTFDGAGGISTVDFTGDGLDDLTFASAVGRELYFFENTGTGMNLIDPPLVVNTDEVRSVLWLDYDNDGDLDFFLTAYGAPNRLYENTGNLVLVDVTAAAGLPVDSASSTCAAAADYDRDGDLDLYVGNYGFLPGGPPPPPDTNFMYRNNGDGTFTDVTGFTGTADSTRQTLAATFFDYNNDGWEDLYVANDRDSFRNALYHNNADGTFSDVSVISGTDITIDAMNVGVADYDNNGYLDIYVTDTQESALLKNNGDGTFTDVAAATGTLFNRLGWGGSFVDFDNDLDFDLYVGCSIPIFPLPNGFFINDGTGNYSEPYQATGGLQGIDYVRSYANAIGDFNNDGKYDLVVCNIDPHPFHIWENIDTNSNHWFKLKLIGTSSNRNAIGAWIEVWIDGQKYLRTTHTHQAFMAQYSHTMII
ncbi:MAG: VCBS repeat-containing protein, partial [Saprospiraceae bacterium]|nr:VCBS repeat-containing protein [Saprospiraceae bacterium]